MKIKLPTFVIKFIRRFCGCKSLPPGPMFFNTGAVFMNYTGTDFDFTLNNRYAGGASDPAGAVKIEMQAGLRPKGSTEIAWSDEIDCKWFLDIGAAPAAHTGDLPTNTDQCYFVYRARFVDAAYAPLSAWSIADERFVADT